MFYCDAKHSYFTGVKLCLLLLVLNNVLFILQNEATRLSQVSPNHCSREEFADLLELALRDVQKNCLHNVSCLHEEQIFHELISITLSCS